jgi:ABC-type multidrug transport system fused ATPase/permease subunit
LLTSERKLSALPRLLLDLLPRRERWALAGVFCVVLVTATFETLGVASILPFMAIVTDPTALARYPRLGQIAGALGAHSWRETVILVAVGTGAMIALGNVAGACSLWLQVRFAARTRHRLAAGLMRAFVRQPYAFHTTRDAASLLKVVEQDVDTVVENVLVPLLNATSRVIVVGALLVLLATQNLNVALIALATLGGAYLIVYQSVRQRQSALGEQGSRAAGEWQRSGYEALGGVKDLIVLDRGESVSTRFADAYQRYVSAESGNAVTAAMPRYFLETIAFGCILVLTVALLLRADAAAGGYIPSLALYAFVGYRLMPGLQQLFAAAATLRFGVASLRTLHTEWTEVGAADLPPAPAQALAVRDVPFVNRISIHELGFTYPRATHAALTGITLEIRRGESVGLVGRSGAGKSTLADILLGLFEPSTGTISVDGVPLSPDSMAGWRRRVGYVPQNVFLANATLAENIGFGLSADEVDHDAMRRAATLAQVDDFAAALPNGYATVVGERGVRLSGGERQRIGIARALYRQPDVLVFDEATSALDDVTEEAVMGAIRRLSGERTIILIAHHPQTLSACDRIALLDAGRLVAIGPPGAVSASVAAAADAGLRA